MDLTILKDIVIIFALSTFVNLVFSKFKIPTAVGYLLTGIITGPHLLGLVDGEHEIEILAEIGVVLLLFTIGMEFSIKHLVKIRKVVFLGGVLQVGLTAGAFYLASTFYDIDWPGGIFIGFLAALSSSALVLKLLQERSELTSNYGRTVLGILIFQDLLLVPLLLFTNLLSNEEVNLTKEILLLSVKVIAILALVYIGNRWLLPKLLHQIALVKNQELFLMSIFLICFSIALLTSKLGMSIAFGAFLAGLMISDNEYSHSAFADLIPFKDTFTSFFFVSIGMLLNVHFVIDNFMLVLLSVILVIAIKTFFAGGVGFVLGHTFRGTVVVGLALSQVGEFSFILAKLGFQLGILHAYFYQLFLAVAVTTMAITPFLMKLSMPLANFMIKILPIPKWLIEGLFPLEEMVIPDYKNHLVIIGKDNTALKLSEMAKHFDIPHISLVFEPSIVREKITNGDNVVYGDAVNEPILLKAHVDTADVVVLSVGDLIPSMAIIEKVKQINPGAYIIIRAKYIKNMEELYALGADQVLPEKLELAIDLFNRVLVKRLYPERDINRMISHVRNIHLGELTEKDVLNKTSLFDDLSNLTISTFRIDTGSEVCGKTIGELELRKRTGATIVAIKRENEIVEQPTPKTTLNANDIAYVMGNPEQNNLMFEILTVQNK